MPRGFGLGLLLIVLAAYGMAEEPEILRAYPERCALLRETDTAQSERERLHALFALEWEYRMADSPETATYFGYPGHNHRWSDNSLKAFERRERDLAETLGVLDSVDTEKLSPEDRLNHTLFRYETATAIEWARFPTHLMPITQLRGIQQDAAQLISIMPTRRVEHYEDILARLRGLPGVVEQTLALLRNGLEKGYTPPRITLRDVPGQVENQLTDTPLSSSLLTPFNEMSQAILPEEKERLREEAVSVYTEQIVPAFRELHRFLTTEYIPHARDSIACADLPDGTNLYVFAARYYTTTDLTPKEIHNIGLSEVKRIREEMQSVIQSSGFTGSYEEFAGFLRTDPQFYFDEADDLLRTYRDISKRADAELVQLFGFLPRLPYGVEPVPSYAEKSQTTAYYMPGSLEAGRPGTFFANTYDLASRPAWEMQALTLHEAVPGHHLQIALAREMMEVPEFRKNSGYTAYIEGWGLYSESLGEEMGFYEDPYSKFGQLTFEMWRAVRLVVDTGMHALGWTREKAIDYFKQQTGRAEHDIVVEIDRYIVWPGQALAYKIGELKIQELRALAERELGGAFDIRAFHDELLGQGALPLDILETRMKAWIARQESSE